MRFGGIAAAIILSLSAILPAAAEGPVRLRVGWVVVPADIMPLIYRKPGIAPHAGKSYAPELTHFTGTPTEMQALATGDLDVAALAYSTFALGVENAAMDDLRVIADVFQDGVPGYHTNGMMVRNDSGIKTVEELKGKIVATNQTGSAVDVAVRAMLSKHGLQDKRDVTMIEVLQDYIGATRFLDDPANRDQAVQLVVDATKQPAELFRDWVFTKQDYYRDPDGLPNLEALQANVDLAQKLGFLRTKLDVGKYTDLSLAKEAAKRLTAANH